MIKEKIYLLAQIVNVMEEAVVKLEEASENKKIEDFEKSKEIILDFQKKLSEELQRMGK